MHSNPELVERLSALLQSVEGIREQKMFGGVGWMLNGNMCVGVYKDEMIIRIGVEAAEEAFTDANVRPMDLTGRVMKGWAMVAPDAWRNDQELKRWADLAIQFVQTLPPK